MKQETSKVNNTVDDRLYLLGCGRLVRALSFHCSAERGHKVWAFSKCLLQSCLLDLTATKQSFQEEEEVEERFDELKPMHLNLSGTEKSKL